MSDKPNPDLQSSAQSSESAPSEDEKGVVKSISEEEGLKSAEKFFKTEESKTEDTSPDEDREFLKFLSYRKRAKELGLDSPSTTIYQGGVHVKDSNLQNYGNIVGNDQTIYPNSSTQNREESEASSDCDRKIELVFDECEDIAQRSFMIALAALNGCNYRVVVEASQKLQTIIQPPVEM
jgi:hypothetical protein